MSDPHSVGAVVALILGLASEAALKGSVGEAAKDTYLALKQKIHDATVSDTGQREEPEELRPEGLAEMVDALPVTQQSVIEALALRLAEALKAQNADVPVGIDVGALEAAHVRLQDLTVSKGIGLRAETIKTPGSFELTGLKVGPPEGKQQQ